MEIARVPTIILVTLVTSGVEYSQVLCVNPGPVMKKVQIKSKTQADSLQVGWTLGGPYFTVFAGQTYWDDNLEAWSLTAYLVGSVNGQVAEIQVWF